MVNNMVKENKTVSDVINKNKFKKDKLNLLISGCGSGKSHYIIHQLHKDLNIEKENIILVTSRTIIKDQTFENYKDTILLNDSEAFRRYLCNLNRNFGIIEGYTNKMPVITYNTFVDLIQTIEECKLLSKISCICFDEFASLFSDATFNTEMQRSLDLILKLLQEKEIWLFCATATDDDLKYYDEIKDKLNYVLDKPIFPYKIENIYFVHSTSLLDKIINESSGKTMCMMYSKDEVLKYKEKYPNSGAIVSVHTEEFKQNKEMQELYDYIIKNKALPNDINILFCTSALREGFEIFDDNVENIICLINDPICVKQFCFRVRKNIKNLFIVNSHNYCNYANKTKAQEIHNEEFLDFIYNRSQKYLSHFLDVRMYNSRKYIYRINFDNSIKEFCNYMINNWCDKPIYNKADKNTIVEYAYSIGLRYTKSNNKHTFNSLIQLFKDNIKEVNFIYFGDTIRINKRTVRTYLFTFKNDNNNDFKYLNDLIGQNLYKDKQEEIKERFGSKQINKLNEIIRKYNLSIESKIIRNKSKTLRIWIISKI